MAYTVLRSYVKDDIIVNKMFLYDHQFLMHVLTHLQWFIKPSTIPK